MSCTIFLSCGIYAVSLNEVDFTCKPGWGEGQSLRGGGAPREVVSKYSPALLATVFVVSPGKYPHPTCGLGVAMCRVFVAWLSVACRVVFSRGAKLLVMSIEDRDYFIRQAYYDEGRSAVELAVEWDLSRSQIHRIVAAGPSAADDDDSDDPWTDEDAATLALLVESDSEELKEPPWI